MVCFFINCISVGVKKAAFHSADRVDYSKGLGFTVANAAHGTMIADTARGAGVRVPAL